jgi:hypothetical protein
MRNPVTDLFVHELQSRLDNIVYHRLAGKHVLGHESELPWPADAIEKASILSIVRSDHKGVEMRCGPETQEREPSSLVLTSELLGKWEQNWPSFGLGIVGRQAWIKMTIRIVVVDEQVQLTWPMWLRIGHGNA